MYILKYKAQGEEIQRIHCKTIQEVAEQIAIICDGNSLAQIMKTEKEYNIRFYLTFRA